MPEGDDKIGEFTVGHLLNTARNAVAKKTDGSTVLDPVAEKRIPKFDLDELTLGNVLGRGGFCVVREVVDITLKNKTEDVTNGNMASDDEHYIHNVVQDRSFMSSHCIRQKTDCRYAIKEVQEASRKDPQVFVNSVVDLAIESRFLTVIRHPNIIKMRAMDAADPYTGKFFIVLDRLYDIMPVRLAKWRAQKQSGFMKMLFDPRRKRAIAFWVERMTVGYDIACALDFLHKMNVIYRDLKPDNVGFDVRGDVKIFDFGLAKELDPAKRSDDGTFKLTGDTGSPRYMAPEVGRNLPYNETADAFSFAIMFWQIAALKTPYEGFTMAMFRKRVINGESRPAIDEKWGTGIVRLLQDCFVSNPQRPSMDDICQTLRAEINKLSDDEIDEMVDASRKSQLSAN